MRNLDFIGLDTEYLNAAGVPQRHVYLDSAATTLALKQGCDARSDMLKHYANLHSVVSAPARICTERFEQARKDILQYFGFDSMDRMAIFLGSGSTATLNYFARFMATTEPHKDIVLVSLMEHHSNDLPHRQWAGRVIHTPLKRDEHFRSGTVDLRQLESLLQREAVRYVAVTHASNVTGIINPIGEICALAHRHGVPVLVDCSQSVVHRADFADLVDVDAMVFSGHKAYAPGTPGVLIIRRSLMSDSCVLELGGGIVDDVSIYDFKLSSQMDDRFQAGTPDFLGVTQLGVTLNALRSVGLQTLVRHEQELLAYAYQRLMSLGSRMCLYAAPPTEVSRVGVITFNLLGVHYERVTRILSDFFCISVRSGCFCAHPYVRSLIRESLVAADVDDAYLLESENYSGMVRVSLGAYSTTQDIDRLVEALAIILDDMDFYEAYYCGSGPARSALERTPWVFSGLPPKASE